ncbi:NADPH-dependent FMN reductase [Speluncibacter jeojiensis]|uniref:NAD(P)H-dependent oxidoreductase n=1 Tax=Speluncibacter jeojiensis TaxID=2710754 RepID=A0A9X4M597_9ACTN|nr:NAD(P)H-dependent oxidoreductase [Rhodococcus sp. D2-41]MDG3017102.1 NAD(P)H-dependent oxidoreductase [Corynebacteriales bacterium D3-21]
MTTILLVSGSTRAGSANTAALRTARGVADVDCVLFDGLTALPAFVPDGAAPPEPVAALLSQIDGADAVLFCTPEYAGTLPGSLKNLLDWTVGGGQLAGKPVAWVNVAPPGRGDGAVATLALVLGYVGAHVVEGACVRVPVARESVGPDGLIVDPAVREGLRGVLGVLTEAAAA